MRPGTYDVTLLNAGRLSLSLRVRAAGEADARIRAREHADREHPAHAPWEPGIPVGPLAGGSEHDPDVEELEGVDAAPAYFTRCAMLPRAA